MAIVLRWLLLPMLAFGALSAWAFASPVGAAPDDDYHLVSIWCANGGSELCQPGSQPDTRMVPVGFDDAFCYVQWANESAACQIGALPTSDQEWFETRRGNFYGEYPPVYYSTMRLFAGQDVEASALLMRVVNALLFVFVTSAVTLLSKPSRRPMIILGWLVTSVPLGMFLIPSNNPSGWATVGVGTAFWALLGWFESEERRRWGLAAVYLIAVVMAAGSRGDAAVYVVGATMVVLILKFARDRVFWRRASVAALGLGLALLLMSMAAQTAVAADGFSQGVGDLSSNPDSTVSEIPTGGSGLAAYNLLMLPWLWTGVFGTWGLGWLDTVMPAIVPWCAASAFIVTGFLGIGMITWRKAVAVCGVLAVLVFLPVYVLTTGGNQVGVNLQPRYLLPLIVLLGITLVFEPSGAKLRFTGAQRLVALSGLAIANFAALHVNIRRYVTGADQQGPNLDQEAEWWWQGVIASPSAVWLLGSLAFALVLLIVGPMLRTQTGPST